MSVTESTAPSTAPIPGEEARKTRRMLEAFHGHADAKAVDAAWPHLASPDRFIRYAARVAIEWQDRDTWTERALAESEPLAALEALLALARVSAPDPAHRTPTGMAASPSLEGRILDSLGRLDWDRLPYALKLDHARVLAVTFNRFGRPDPAVASALAAKLDSRFPAKGRELNVELCNLLVYLGSPSRRGQGDGPDGVGAHAGGADGLRPRPPSPPARLDPRIPAGLFRLDRPSRRLQGGAEPRRLPQADQGRSRRHPDRVREGRLQADLRRPAPRQVDRRRPDRPCAKVRQELDLR